jgi:methylmalonyl-CoA mutase
MRIEEAAARKQARIDSQKDIIVGLNKYKPDREDPVDILEVDNTAVREAQVRRLNKLKAERDNRKITEILDRLTDAARTGKDNLLELSVEAAKRRATLGEISLALEKVYSRYKAVIRSVSGVYSSESAGNENYKSARELVAEFASKEGRQPRIMVAKMGQDGHDRGAKVVATGYADIGFDVDIGPLFQTPAEAARQAVENDVHILGISTLAGGHKTLIPQVIKELKALDRADIMVIAGGVIPPQDYDFLYKAGVVGIFGPGTSIPLAAIKILQIMLEGS